ncbi:HlyD family secretion protein [Enhydrobacter sp.]|uniref:efflux RND transporter periplasmic adaptor subunit n=1 Tax=Enhydrobacter sp. TaxID=1894999 RepID=UPI00260C4D85|nr:HlyD family secretion protein [Enhydrobacter sp.]WIM13608.1 MAG: Tetrapartite efflux system, membrane fusion component FusE-like [Enhydrobacter sp.]
MRGTTAVLGRIALTVLAVVLAALLGRLAWQAYMETPWTRDGTVRAYVIRIVPEVSGQIVELPIKADQAVRKGDPLLQIDKTDYKLALDNAQAVLAQSQANLDNTRLQAERRLKLSALSISVEEQQTYAAQARIAEANLDQAKTALERARVNLQRTRLASPVNGYVTNLTVQAGDYATAGQRVLSLVDTDSYWVEGYFEETQLRRIKIGDRALVSLMGYRTPIEGHVAGISHGIMIPNAQPDAAGLPSVNPIFTWIRLAQRIPVRVELDSVPKDVTLAIGLTATVEIVER